MHSQSRVIHHHAYLSQSWLDMCCCFKSCAALEGEVLSIPADVQVGRRGKCMLKVLCVKQVAGPWPLSLELDSFNF